MLGEDQEHPLLVLVAAVRDVSAARRSRTVGSALLRARAAVTALQEAASTDAELRIGCRVVGTWLEGRR